MDYYYKSLKAGAFDTVLERFSEWKYKTNLRNYLSNCLFSTLIYCKICIISFAVLYDYY